MKNRTLAATAVLLVSHLMFLCAVVLTGAAQAPTPTPRQQAKRDIAVVVGPQSKAGSVQLAGASVHGKLSHRRSHSSNSVGSQFFAPVTDYLLDGLGGFFVAIGDFDGDGVSDIAVASQTQATLLQFQGLGDGTFHLYPNGFRNSGTMPWGMAAADVNGDGIADVLFANNCGEFDCTAGEVSILFGHLGGGFVNGPAYNVFGAFTHSVAVGDVNGDGIPDLVVADACYSSSDCTTGDVEVFLGDGTGSFTFSICYRAGGGVTPPPFARPGSMTLADFNRDGHLDIAVVSLCCPTGNVSILLGNGDGTFQPEQKYSSGYVAGNSVAVGDINGDGISDLAVANFCETSSCDDASAGVLLGNGDGTFQNVIQKTLGIGFSAESFALGDIDGDGRLDLVVGNYCTDTDCATNNLGLLLGNGDGSFQNVTVSDAGGTLVNAVAVGDFNGDGRLDVAVGTTCGQGDCTNGSLGVLLQNRSTSTSVAATPPNPVYGQSITLVALVTASNGTQTGTVTFTDGSTLLGSGDLSAGEATLAVPGVAVGTHSIVASYSGDSIFDGSNSSPLSFTVSPASTQTILTNSPNPSATGQAVIFSATVVPPFGASPGGTVNFSDGTNVFGAAAVISGVASLSTNVLSAGTHTITAVYSGDNNFLGSTSNPTSQVVLSATTTVITSSVNPSMFGQQIVFTTAVTALGATPQGSVTFTANGKLLGSVTLVGGLASLGLNNLKVGSTPIVATYGGTKTFQGSTGNVIQVVNGAVATSTTITGSSLNPSKYGDVVTFTASVTAENGTPTGSVRFTAAGKTLGQVTLANGIATITTKPGQLPGGAVAIVASYIASKQFSGSISPTFFQTVNPVNSTTTLVSSSNPSTYGQAVSFTVTESGSFAVPTGRVRFRDGTTLLATVPLSNGVAVYTTTALTVGTHTITASYTGDLNYVPSSGMVTEQIQ